MTRSVDRPGDAPRLAIAMVLAATFIFSVGDIAAKALLDTLSPVQVSWMRSLIVVAVTLPMTWLRLRGNPLRTARPGLQMFRGLAVVASSVLFLAGLARLPIADAVALNFVAPILMLAFAAPILGERVGPAHWLAALVGFVGVLIVIRPGAAAFQPESLFPIAAAALWALATVVTRRMTATERPETTIAWSAVIGAVVLTAFAPLDWRVPTPGQFGLALIVGVASAAAHSLFVFASERARASVLAPFSYGQLVWATLLGYLAFGTAPDAATIAGATLIVASGLYSMKRRT